MAATGKGYRYPATSDPVAQGATAIQNLANDCNGLAGSSACGSVNVHLANAPNGSASVTFPAGRFINPPKVVSVATNSTFFTSCGTITMTGVTLYVRHYQNTSVTNDIGINWIARL